MESGELHRPSDRGADRWQVAAHERLRVTLSFDLHIGDEPAARQIVADYIRDLSQQTVAEGGRVENDAAATLENPRAVASTLAAVILARGAATTPGVRVPDVAAQSEPR